MNCRAVQREKTTLLIIAGGAVALLGAIAIIALLKGDKVSSESATLIGVIATALATFSKDAITTIRASWQDDRIGKMTDQIAASAPAATPDPLADAKPAGTPEDPVSVSDVTKP